MADIFLSYSHRDLRRANVVARRLEEAGFSVWWDPELRKGRFENVIETERRGARCAVVLWSASSIESDWVPAEADRSRIEDKLVQVRIDDGIRIPLPFEWLHALELTDWDPEPTEEGFRELLEGVREVSETSPLLRRAKSLARRLWRPTRVSILRPWELLIASVLAVCAGLVVVAWGIGSLNAGEAALWGAAVLVGWVFWLLARRQLERRFAGHPWSLRRLSRAGAATAALAVVWAGGFHALYSVRSFGEKVSGFYVARLLDDRWDRGQREFTEILEQEIEEANEELGTRLQVEALPRRVTGDEEARHLLRRGNAALLLRGEVRDEGDPESGRARLFVELRRAPGIFSRRSRVASARGGTAGASAPLDQLTSLARAVGLFFAGYTLYHEGDCDLAVDYLLPAVERFRELPLNEVQLKQDGVGVHESLLGTAALFLGNCRALLGDTQGAVESYDEAIRETRRERRSHFVEALVNKGAVYIEQGPVADAIDPLEEGEKSCETRWLGLSRDWSAASPEEWPDLLACSYLYHNLGVAEVLLGDAAAGRDRFETATQVTAAAIQIVPADPREELLALQAFHHQKLAWATAKEHQWNRIANRGADGGEDSLATAADSLETAVSLWTEHQDAPLPRSFRLTQARLDVAHREWTEAQPELERLAAEGAGVEDPEVFLLLAITQRCCGDLMGSVENLKLYNARAVERGEDPATGFEQYRYWRERCKDNDQPSIPTSE